MTGWDVSLLRPLWLLALPVLGLAGWWLMTRAGGLGDWRRVSDPSLMRAMAALGRLEQASDKGSLRALLIALVLVVIALSGPAIERRDALSYRNLDGVIFVVDASPSMTEDARWPQMQSLGRFALASLGTRPGGLIVYAGDSYVASDMTLDHLQLGQSFSLIDANTVPNAGSRPARALEQAAALLAGAEVIAGDVVLLTDGEGLGAESLTAAARIAGQGARLSLVAMGDPAPAFATHAAAGQGRVFALTETDALADWLGTSARTRLEAQEFPLLFWRDMGRLLLLVALLPLLLLFRRSVA